MEREIRQFKDKYDTVLTHIDSSLGQPYIDNVASWNVSSRTIVVTPYKMPAAFGMYQKNPQGSPIKFQELIGFYLMEIPGWETFVMCDPTVILGGDISRLYEMVAQSRFERTWAAWASIPGQSVPAMFVLSTTLLPYIHNDAPYDMTMDGWQYWMDGWLKKSMQGGRYLDASGLGLVLEFASYPVSSPSKGLPEDVVSQIKEETKTMAKPKGRPKKKKNA